MAKFSLKKKNVIFCEYLPFTSMNNRQKEVRNFKSVNIYFRPPKWAKWFFTWTKENSNMFWSPFFNFLKIKEDPLAQAPKTF